MTFTIFIILLFVLFLFCLPWLGTILIVKFSITSEIKLYAIYTVCGIFAYIIYHIFVLGPLRPPQFLPTGILVIYAIPILLPVILILNTVFIKQNNLNIKITLFIFHIFYFVVWLRIPAHSAINPVTFGRPFRLHPATCSGCIRPVIRLHSAKARRLMRTM